ncbi:MAG: hypothetical protein D6797_04775 [Bdellovibrio sp.]|nr:MAG: hypothetical protein D6797_04775 [Bdellovibrio sp.]
MKTLAAFILMMCVLAGCSVRNLTSTSSIDGTYVNQAFSQMFSSSLAISTLNTSAIEELFNNLNTITYFAEAPSDMGPPQSLISLADFQFMGMPENTSPYDFDFVQIFFLTNFVENKVTLVIYIEYQNQPYLKVFENNPQDPIEFNEEFVVVMYDAQSQSPAFTLHSFDLNKVYNNMLADTIQLHMFLIDENGEEVSNGKFSSLIGFGLP